MKKKRLLASALACVMLVSSNASCAFADTPVAISVDATTEAVAISDTPVNANSNITTEQAAFAEANNFQIGNAYDGDLGRGDKASFSSDVFDYTDQLAMYEEKGYKAVSSDVEIHLDINKAVGEKPFVFEEGELTIGQEDPVKVKGVKFYDTDEIECPYIEWTFDVETEGIYEMYVNMKAEESYGTIIQRKIEIDGEVPFDDLYNVYFARRFKETEDGFDADLLAEGVYKVRTNAIGNEIMPSHEEMTVWQQQAIVDNDGYYIDPMQFYFSKGTHTIRFSYVDQDIVMGDVYLRGAKEYDTYEEYQSEHADAEAGSGKVVIQAENVKWTSESTIRRDSDTDPETQSSDNEKNSATTQMLNIIGGSRWQEGNQTITWEFEVEEDGLYTFNMRGRQDDSPGMPSYRQVLIDGEIPFEELKLYNYKYVDGWNAFTMEDEEGKPYEFYLEKGKHELTMTVKSGFVADIVTHINDAITQISDVYLDITKITGTSPDSNLEYDLGKEMSDLPDRFNAIAATLDQCSEVLRSISTETTDMEGSFNELIATFKGFAADPDTVVAALSDLEDAQTSLGDYILNMGNMPLTFDYIEVLPVGEEFEIQVGGGFKKFWFSVLNFFASFVKNYDAVGSLASEDGDYETISVWIARGREWGEVLKGLADETFLHDYKTSVSLNILPSGQLNAGNISALMLAVTSNSAPDAAIGIAYSEPVEYAYRDAILDLTQFEDLDAVKSEFYDTMFVPYTYSRDGHEGVYALPETMDFTCMMYRTDVFESLELEVPETWDELWSDTLPILIENSMSFSFPVDTTASSNSPSSLKGMTMYLLQGEGAYYRDTKESQGYIAADAPVEGLYSNLDTPEAFKAFEQWTDMYLDYGLDAESSFFTRFRTGTLPIGIGSYASYMQILTQAPELYGRWAIAPMLGTKLEDGTIDNSVGGISLTACQIMSQTEKPEAAWNFIKWWMSKETQIEYGNEIEATMGIEARWNSANKYAFESLPWDEDDIEIIQEMMGKAVEQPIVLGGYFTTRHLVNAWTRVYLNNQDPRDSLEEAVKDINKELRVKHEEYGFVYDEE